MALAGTTPHVALEALTRITTGWFKITTIAGRRHLPNFGEEVLVFMPRLDAYELAFIAHDDDGNKCWKVGSSQTIVPLDNSYLSHWQYLPPRPKRD